MPVLGICYGMQLMTQVLGGTVTRSSQREFGHADVTVGETGRLFAGLASETLKVWMSHGDQVAAAPPGFDVVASSTTAPVRRDRAPRSRRSTACSSTPRSRTRRTAPTCCEPSPSTSAAAAATGRWRRSSTKRSPRSAPRSATAASICGLSGGVDSSVAALLVHKAIGDQLTCIFVDNGLLRDRTSARRSRTRFRDRLQLPLVVVDAASRFLARLAGVTDPEKKRKIIGAVFIDVFEDAAQDHRTLDFLAQGTLYPDVIESVSVRRPGGADQDPSQRRRPARAHAASS